MIVIYPTNDHPLVILWNKYQDRLDELFTDENLEALKDIQDLLNYYYPNGCVVGHLIMERDLMKEKGGKL